MLYWWFVFNRLLNEFVFILSLFYFVLRRLFLILFIYSNYLNILLVDNKVIDFSMKFVSSGEFEDGDWKFRIIVEYLKREEVFNNVFKSFFISEIESEEKRDVIIIFITFIGDFGIYYCFYCNIFFYDFIMYYFYKSLYSFVDDDFFRCFSC